MLATAIIALARITFRVLVGQHRSLGLAHGARDDVFRGDQLDLVVLPTAFRGDSVPEFGVDHRQRSVRRGAEVGLDRGAIHGALVPAAPGQ